jgi:hypothetical protein
MAINKTAAGTFVVDFRDQNGKRIRKTFPTYKRASDYDKEVIAQVSRGDFILPSKDTVKDIAEKLPCEEEGGRHLPLFNPLELAHAYR